MSSSFGTSAVRFAASYENFRSKPAAEGILESLRLADTRVFMNSPVWVPDLNNRVTHGGLCLMHGGPSGMQLPEHEHPEVQLGLHFTAPAVRGNASADPHVAHVTLVPSGKPHRGGWTNGSEVIVAHFSRSILEQASDEVLTRCPSEVFALTCGSDPLLHALGYALRRQFKSGGIADPVYVDAISVVLTRHLMTRWTPSPQRRVVRGKLTATQLRKTFAFIEAHLKDAPSISALAAELHMGPHHFTRLFGRSTGMSPYQFIQRKRVERACLLLETTDLTLTDIAFELGFVSHSHFTAVFRQHYAVTPSAYRSRSGS
jgi:AraC family transcriptional regulator